MDQRASFGDQSSMIGAGGSQKKRKAVVGASFQVQ